MQERIEKIIYYLCHNNRYCTAKEIATHLKISERTFYRIIPYADRWLSRQNYQLESKTNQGYQIKGDKKEILLKLKDEKDQHLDLTTFERQDMILIYLLFQEDIIKIGELATVFYMSETSINNDLAQIEEKITYFDLVLYRKKGSGIIINGEELAIRSCIIEAFTRLIPYDVVIHYLRGETDDIEEYHFSINKLNHFLEIIGISLDWEKEKQEIKNLEQKLGYYFSYSGFTTLLLYVIITKYRIQMKRSHWKPFSKELHPVYLQLA
ncbi:MAG: helix-turn-helix domain-containing protein, partial [Spirochaetes bacterium]|nr:helix-turn-helix domain-containing protein [Spirochaetota bacterium]